MSDIRYSQGHSIARLGVFALPIVPFFATAGWADNNIPYLLGWGEVGMAWCIALLTHLVLIAGHESAHYLAARTVGIRIKEITIGHWRRLAGLNLGETSIVLRAIPDSGYVVSHPSHELGSKGRLLVFLSAGVVFDLLAIATAIQTVRPLPTSYSSFSGFLALFLCWTVIVFGSLHVVQNLWPWHAEVGGRRLATDGKQILDALRSPGADPGIFSEQLRRAQEIESLLSRKNYAGAITALESLCSEQPRNIAAICLLSALWADNGQHDRAISELMRAEKLDNLSLPEKAQIFDGLACVVLYHDLAERLGEAEAWIRTAITYSPQAITLQGTLGAILLEKSRVDEAEPILRRVLAISEDEIDHSIAQACLAKLAMHRGKKEEAQALLATAQSHPHIPGYVARIAREIS